MLKTGDPVNDKLQNSDFLFVGYSEHTVGEHRFNTCLASNTKQIHVLSLSSKQTFSLHPYTLNVCDDCFYERGKYKYYV